MTERRNAVFFRRFVDQVVATVITGTATIQQAADELRRNGVPMPVALRILAGRK